jgi:hypothetical protein
MIGMQNKTIKKVLDKKLKKWLDSIDDCEVKQIASDNVIVTGGSIASMAMGDEINDFDLYFKTKASTKTIAEYYVNKFNSDHDRIDIRVYEDKLVNILGEAEDRIVIYIPSSGIAGVSPGPDPDETHLEVEEPSLPDEGEKYRPVFMSENAITLSHSVQLVTRFYGSPEEIHRNYDFVHAKCYYNFTDRELVMPAESLRAMQSRTLHYEGSLYPVCSLFRMRKFINRGWKINAGEILKMAMQISAIDLTNPNILKEQLTGVDFQYFAMLISILSKAPTEDNGNYSTSYIIEVIDKIFGE